jgi:hypothetical protein
VLVVVPTALTAVETGAQLSPVTFSGANSTSPSATVTVDGGLPIGVSITDGVLSGMPTEPGDFPLEVTVVDGFGCTASSSLTFTVNASATYQATTLALSAVTPAYALTSTSLVATLGGFTGAPTGTVTFYEGTTELGSAAMTSAGTATLDVDTLTAGTHVLTATYLGDATFGGSRAAAFTLEVVRIPTSTTLALQDTSLVASVTSTVAQPAGYVQFTVDGVAQAPVPVNASGLATISAPSSVGMHTAQADFVENDRFSASSAMTLAVNIVADGGMTTDGGMSANDGGTTTGNDGGTGGSETPKPGCGCSQVDVGAMLLAALALFRRRARV